MERLCRQHPCEELATIGAAELAWNETSAEACSGRDDQNEPGREQARPRLPVGDERGEEQVEYDLELQRPGDAQNRFAEAGEKGHRPGQVAEPRDAVTSGSAHGSGEGQRQPI